MPYLPREDAPFGAGVWDLIDGAVIGAAKSQLAGRRVLELVGPLGLGVQVIPRGEQCAETEVRFRDTAAGMTVPQSLPLPMLHAEFALSIRAIAATEETKAPLDLAPAVMAAIACARLEDELVFQGNGALGIEGLLSSPESARVKLGDWAKLGTAADDLIKAVSALDAAGFPGPYTAALAPGLYNALLRAYPQTDMTQMEHAKQIITDGLVKAPALASGGVVLATGAQFAAIVLGQDMAITYVGPTATTYEFVVVESLTPRIMVPEAICVLE